MPDSTRDKHLALSIKYYNKWKVKMIDYNSSFSEKSDHNKQVAGSTTEGKFDNFKRIVHLLQADFEKDVEDIAKTINDVPPDEACSSAAFLLAKIVYLVTYERNLLKPNDTSRSPLKFCWWVCLKELNAIQFTKSILKKHYKK